MFGGTFNPPHLGHVRIAQHFFNLLSLDKIIVIPANIPPHKAVPELASGADRLEMCRLTFALDGFEVSDIELKSGGKSYTYNTLKKIRRLYPDAQLYLIIGEDMLLTFNSWYKNEEILKMCTICSARREPGTPLAERLPPELKNAGVIISEYEPLVLSSTEIRDSIDNELFKGLPLAPGVLEYIVSGGLYND